MTWQIVAIALLCWLVGALIGYAAGYREAMREVDAKAVRQTDAAVAHVMVQANAAVSAEASREEALRLLESSKE